ncbi:hypothetical protein EKO04_001233 [Ascochyta lentis]|uniref:Uncharacterized protein n=1 Tax=Ascochyta lentis TaxID=205686 RepID=A0A8H7MMB0_9PLEO|nr:hypothetical protein EKO04_001233 [Ascochyta lentis]
MHLHTTSFFGSAILLSIMFASAATAQLLGCDAVGCPVDEYRNAQCEIGNATLKAIGVANVTSVLDSRPLTWTLGLQELKGNGTNPTFDRNFYLGTPPYLQLNDTKGCALFFEGVSENLTSSSGDQLNKFTCSSALAEACVSDLIAQAQSSYEGFDDEFGGGSDLCNQLRDTLVNKPPTTCSGVKGSWGTIVAQHLTGISAPAKIEQKQCHPTTGRDYDLSLIASIRKEASGRELSKLAPILNAITPVMTIISKGNDTGVELSCLKLVEMKANQTVDSQPSKGSTSLPRSSFALFATIAAVAYFFVL